ncbi:MAG: hypothetical protein HY078_15440 [Elusimicrobia bacterium]|nr:hypothetical protein [Elusimicrobiota bacterium]
MTSLESRKLPAYAAAAVLTLCVSAVIVRHRNKAASLARNVERLGKLRAAVLEHKKRTGRFPERLEDAGAVPPLEGMAARHPNADAGKAIELRDAWITMAVLFATADTSGKGASLVGGWTGNGTLVKEDMSCARGVCTTKKRLSPGPYRYGLYPRDPKVPPIPVLKREITLAAPHGDGVWDVDARDALTDAGRWGYDPSNGRVLIACTCTDLGPSAGRAMYKY